MSKKISFSRLGFILTLISILIFLFPLWLGGRQDGFTNISGGGYFFHPIEVEVKGKIEAINTVLFAIGLIIGIIGFSRDQNNSRDRKYSRAVLIAGLIYGAFWTLILIWGLIFTVECKFFIDCSKLFMPF